MRTYKYSKLHNRCLSCLEMIERCDKFIFEQRAALARYRAMTEREKWGVLSNEATFVKSINRIECIRLRIIKWYADIFQRLQSETSEFRTPDWLTENIGTLILTPEQQKEAEEEYDNECLYKALSGYVE